MQAIPEAVFFEQSQFSLQYKKLSASIQQIVLFPFMRLSQYTQIDLTFEKYSYGEETDNVKYQNYETIMLKVR